MKLGERVVVIGGGNAAIDSRPHGASAWAPTATVVYRRERKDMPAIPEEVEAAEHEGVRFLFLAAPHRIVGEQRRGQGDRGGQDAARRVRHVGPPPADRHRRSAYRSSCNSVILAVGEGVDTDFCQASGLTIKESGMLEVDRYTLETSREKFYAGGDLITGASNVSNAMGYGKKAARNIDSG